MATITGTNGSETLNGTSVADDIHGLDGDDTLNGGLGNDLLEGGAGADVLDGGGGTDTATYANSSSSVNVNLASGVGLGGEAQGDTFISIDRLIGSAFNDTLGGATTTTELRGGAGDDVYLVVHANNAIAEAVGEGNDEVRTALGTLSIATFANVEKLTYTGVAAFIGTGNAEDNIITGGIGNDALSGLGGADILNGGDGNDTLNGGAGADQLFGGKGTDTASYAGSSSVSINLKTGVHTGDAAGDVYDSIEIILGTNNADTFVGDANANQFDGANGSDTIDYSASGAGVNVNLATNVNTGGDAAGDSLLNMDRVIGSAFNDTLGGATTTTELRGGAGDDVYLVVHANNAIAEAVGEGNDEVRTALGTLSIATFANVEKLTYTGVAAFIGTGNAEDNIITGGIGNDLLSAGVGADILIGGGGGDTLTGGANSDRFVLAANFGKDTITDFVAGIGSDDLIEFSTAVFANFAAVLAAAAQVGANTVITYDVNNTVTLTGVTLANLHTDDFGFV